MSEEKEEIREKTSIKIKPKMWKEAKIAAINEGKTVSEVVEEALQEWISSHSQKLISDEEAKQIAKKYAKPKANK